MRKLCLTLGLGLAFLGCSLSSQADEGGTYQVSREVVERTMADLVKLMREAEPPADEAGRQQLIRELVERNLDPVVDFKRIVKRIMGKHFADASKEQRNNFLDVFRNSLINTYGKYLLDSDLRALAEKLHYMVLPLGRQRREGKSSVNCIISLEGKEYEVVFSMYYNKQAKKWLMENMIVEGINLGINYRTQFDRLMVSYNGDYDRAIAEWSTVDGGDNDGVAVESTEGGK